jgi:hypothetical protein
MQPARDSTTRLCGQVQRNIERQLVGEKDELVPDASAVEMPNDACVARARTITGPRPRPRIAPWRSQARLARDRRIRRA